MMLTARHARNVYSFLGLTVLAALCSFAAALFILGPRQSKMAQTALTADELIASSEATFLSAEPIQVEAGQALGTTTLSPALQDKLFGHASGVVGTLLPFSAPRSSSIDFPNARKAFSPVRKPTLADMEGRQRSSADEKGAKIRRRRGSLVGSRNRH